MDKPNSHKVEIVPVVLEPHPNADSLSIVRVWGFTVCVRTLDWLDKSMGAYIQPDSIVPDTEQFAFLNGSNRIRVKRLRGIISMGMLIPAPDGAKIGDDVSDMLGITHYEPPIKNSNRGLKTGGESEPAPSAIYAPKYDIENMLRYHELFIPGEEVIVTEKIHGANARFVYHEGRMWCGSRTEWKKQDENNLWWKALEQNPEIKIFCQIFEGAVIYAEIFGNVQSLKYGANGEQYFIRIFDILFKGEWINYSIVKFLCGAHKVKMVPEIANWVPFNLEKLKELAEGNSLIEGANHIREGIVVRPMIERRTNEIGRLQLKLISSKYLENN